MSRCRWSSNNWTCDLYIYDSANGIEVHVAANRHAGPISAVPSVLNVTKDEWVRAMELQRAAMDSTVLVPIGGPHDGASYTLDTEEELAELLTMLRTDGYHFPDDLVDADLTFGESS